MTVLCVNSGVTYADIAAADASESGISYGVPTHFKQSGASLTDVVLSNSDYPDSCIYEAADGEETDGTTSTGAQCLGAITTSVANGVIKNLRTGIINFSFPSAVGHQNLNLVSDGGGGDVYAFSTSVSQTSINCIRYNCSEGCRS